LATNLHVGQNLLPNQLVESIRGSFVSENYSSIMIFGRTGSGKSHLANRLLLNFDNLNDKSMFAVGSISPTTFKIQEEFIVNDLKNVIGIVDTPGLLDGQRTIECVTSLCEYFRDYGNCKQVFVIPIKLNDAVIDRRIPIFLYFLYKLIGKELWKILFFVINNVDGHQIYSHILKDNMQKFDASKCTLIDLISNRFQVENKKQITILPMGEHNDVNNCRTIKILFDACQKVDPVNLCANANKICRNHLESIAEGFWTLEESKFDVLDNKNPCSLM